MIPSQTPIVKIGLNYCIAHNSAKVLGQEFILTVKNKSKSGK